MTEPESSLEEHQPPTNEGIFDYGRAYPSPVPSYGAAFAQFEISIFWMDLIGKLMPPIAFGRLFLM